MDHTVPGSSVHGIFLARIPEMDTACCLTLQMETLRYGWIKEICPKWASQVVLVIKNPSANAGDIETQVQSLGQEDPLEKVMATCSSILGWRIP